MIIVLGWLLIALICLGLIAGCTLVLFGIYAVYSSSKYMGEKDDI